MKKAFVLSLILVFAIFSAFADIEIASLSSTIGYSSINKDECVGGASNYVYGFEASDLTAVGYGGHIDIAGFINKNDAISFGMINGIGIESSLADNVKVELIAGPALCVETLSSKDAVVSFGLGIDANYSFFFDMNSTIGISFGGTGYAKVLNYIDDNTRTSGLEFSANGYVGLIFRFGNSGYYGPGYYGPLGPRPFFY